MVRPYRIRIHLPCAKDEKKLRRYYESKLAALPQKYMIPKCYLIDWLCSDDYNNTNRKSRRHIDMLWEVQKWRDGR